MKPSDVRKEERNLKYYINEFYIIVKRTLYLGKITN